MSPAAKTPGIDDIVLARGHVATLVELHTELFDRLVST
jgi:hypothetical protein